VHIGHEGAKIAARGARAVGSSVEVLTLNLEP